MSDQGVYVIEQAGKVINAVTDKKTAFRLAWRFCDSSPTTLWFYPEFDPNDSSKYVPGVHGRVFVKDRGKLIQYNTFRHESLTGGSFGGKAPKALLPDDDMTFRSYIVGTDMTEEEYYQYLDSKETK